MNQASTWRHRRPLTFSPNGKPQLDLPGTEGARFVETDDYLWLRSAMRDAYAVNGIVALIGERGLGKTYSAYRAAGEVAGSPPAYLEIPPDPIGKELERDMIQRVTLDYDVRATRAQMRSDLREMGAMHRYISLLDEIERAQGYGIELVRYLWTQHGNQVTYVLIGTDLGHFLAANPALASRVTRTRRFREWTPDEAIEIAPRYHDLFKGASPKLLRHIYDHHAGGSFRRWGHVVEGCLAEMRDTGATRLSRALVDAAWARHGE
jgi:hypothetical protein